ncbi:hypothetical protein, partial [Ornithinimicrobium cavernae]|uniref:hypothetical protein n=1 Tax=Ornithinimicrobium cavernae TaxID=2666047 RepID=UPI0012B1784F
MDTVAVREQIRQCLRRPPAVREASAASGFSGQLWVTSFADLLPPEQPADAGSDGRSRGKATDEQGTDATGRLRVALGDLGVDEAMVQALTDVALACATVATTDEQPSVVARGQALLGSIESLTTTAGQLDAVLLSATTQLTATNGQLLLLDKEAVSPEE